MVLNRTSSVSEFLSSCFLFLIYGSRRDPAVVCTSSIDDISFNRDGIAKKKLKNHFIFLSLLFPVLFLEVLGSDRRKTVTAS